jgi:hypothetical protein
MQEYKYTYQDWIDDNIQGQYLMQMKKDFSPEDFIKIEKLTREAAIKRVNDLIKVYRRVFFVAFNMSLVKDDVLSEWISRAELKISYFKKEEPETVFIARIGGGGMGNFLTLAQIEEYMSFDVDKAHFNSVFDLYNELEKGTEVLNYIIHFNFLKWLNWFRTEQLKDTSEPFVFISTNINEESQLRELLRDKNTSYKWQSNPDKELKNLYQCLKVSQLIHASTTLDQFKAVFEAKPLMEIQPIDWIGGKSLLAYFVDCIYNNKLIHFNTNQWSVARNCFTNAKDLAQSKDRYLDNKNLKHPGKPKNHNLIDEALKGLN